MIISNTEKLVKNSLISFITQICYIFLQFINRRIFIIFLDIEFLGYQSLFINIFSLLSLAELGIGNIITFHLYREIENNNNENIGKLIYIYKVFYFFIFIFVLVVGICLIPLLPYIVKNPTIDRKEIIIIYIIQLLGVAICYLFSYRRAVFVANQSEYICERINLYVSIVIQLVQLIILSLTKNYYIYLFFHIIIPIITNIIIKITSDVKYPFLNEKYKFDKKLIQEKNILSDLYNFIIHKIAYVIYGGTDSIIISSFIGIRYVALYGNYDMIKLGITQIFFYKLLNPLQAIIGKIVYSDRKKEYIWKQFKMLDIFSFFFATYVSLGFLIFYQPIIELWFGKNYLLPYSYVCMFSITMYFVSVWEIVNKYRSLYGNYDFDRCYMIFAAMINIIISLIGCKYFGLCGVQFGTLLAFLFIAYGRIKFVVAHIFNESIVNYLLYHLLYFMIYVIMFLITSFITTKLPVSLFGIIIRVTFWSFFPVIFISFVLYKNKNFNDFKNHIKLILYFFIKKFI